MNQRIAKELKDEEIIQILSGNFSTQTLTPYTRASQWRYKADQRAGRFLRSVLAYSPRIFERMLENQVLERFFAVEYLDEKRPHDTIRPTTLLRLLLKKIK